MDVWFIQIQYNNSSNIQTYEHMYVWCILLFSRTLKLVVTAQVNACFTAMVLSGVVLKNRGNILYNIIMLIYIWFKTLLLYACLFSNYDFRSNHISYLQSKYLLYKMYFCTVDCICYIWWQSIVMFYKYIVFKTTK